MKINLNKALTNLLGEDMVDASDNDTVVTAKTIAINALMTLSQDDAKMEGKDRYERYELALRISDAKEEVDLSSEEISKIKELVGIMYTPLIVGRVYDILEGK